MSHGSSSKPLVSVTPSLLEVHKDSSRLAAVALCHGDQQHWSFHTSQSFSDDTDLGLGQLRTLDLGLGGSWAVYQVSLIRATRANSPALLRLGYPMLPLAEDRVSSPALIPWGLLTNTHTSWASSTMLPSHAPGLLSQMLQLARDRASSPVLMMEDWGWSGGCSSLTPALRAGSPAPSWQEPALLCCLYRWGTSYFIIVLFSCFCYFCDKTLNAGLCIC